MEIKEERAKYSIERKEAAAMLGVSMRTIDRYIRSGKLAHKKVGYNVFLSKDELEHLITNKSQEVDHVDIVDNAIYQQSSPQQSTDVSTSFQKRDEFFEGPSFDTLVYKSLYEGTKKELDAKQKEVEVLNYKLGKMEIELGNAVPMLEYKQDQEKTEDELRGAKAMLDVAKHELEMTRRFNTRLLKEKGIYVGAILLLALLSTILASSAAI